ncbi:hypothetical protein Asp14428_13870 [Actinoplanes sp. NBRC 14428]|nr:hypothetical protein Asp14428_13870 [Actinoplanes sp. NBRC 14428]
MTVEFRVLGDIEVRIDHRVVEVGHVRQRCVLAALLVDANQTVPVDQVVDRVWGNRVPQRARNAVAGYLSRLRRVLAGTDDARIVRQPGGYQLAVDPGRSTCTASRSWRAGRVPPGTRPPRPR